MFCQFHTQQLVSRLSDIIRRDPAAANQSPVSSAAPWWAWNDGARGMPCTCADIVSVIISLITQWIFATKRKSSSFTDSLTHDLSLFLFFGLLLLVMSTSISRDSFTTWRGGGPAWNTYYIVTFNLSASAFLLWPDSVQIPILKCRSEFLLPIVIMRKRSATKHFKSSWVQTDLISWSGQTNGCTGCCRHASKTSSYRDNGKNTPWGVRH